MSSGQKPLIRPKNTEKLTDDLLSPPPTPPAAQHPLPRCLCRAGFSSQGVKLARRGSVLTSVLLAVL